MLRNPKKSLAFAIARQLANGAPTLVALQNLDALREAARLAGKHLPVRWELDRGVPPSIVDYLTGGVQGALEGALVGLSLELAVAAVFPAVAFGFLLAGGAAAGAAVGVARVRQGWRIRMKLAPDGTSLLEVSVV